MREDADILHVDVDAAENEHIGTRLGEYELLEKIGAGATCNVYRARHVSEGTEVAIKVLELTPSTRRTHVQRMRREASVSLNVDHPNLIKIYEFQRVPAKCAYLVMELVPGRSLFDLICEQQSFPPERAARIIREIGAALVAAHDGGYVHRDLKPGNVMIYERDGVEHVKLLDFGIVGAKKSATDTILTEEHSILGTPTYMAPEQLESPNVGPAADLYALGGILYHLLAGKPPFGGSFREIVAQQMVAAPDPLPYVEGLGPLAHWLLEKAPEKRPENAAQVVQLVDTIIAELNARQKIGPLALPPPAPAPPAPFDPLAFDSWTGSLVAGVSRVMHWPLRLTIPLVSVVAIAGGAFAARHMLREPVPEPRATMTAVAPPISGVPVTREDIALTAPRSIKMPRIDPIGPLDLAPAELSARELPPPSTQEQVLDFSGPETSTDASSKKRLVQGVDILKDKSVRRYAMRLSEREVHALRKRLARIDAAIKRSQGTIPKPQLRRFEARYRSLALMAKPELGELGRDGLVSHIETLSAQIATTDSQYRR